MNKKIRINFSVSIFILSFILLFIGSNFWIFAAEDKNQTQGVAISPPVMEVSADPGETIEKQIKLTNPLDHTVQLYPLVYDFLARGEEGQQNFFPPTSEAQTYSLASWISHNRPVVSLAQNEEDIFDFQIDVPKDAEPGGHYGVVFFSTAPEEVQAKPGQITISGMVGSLILLKVSGDIHERAEIVEFSAPKYSLSGPINFVTRIENLGNIHFKPRGSINILDWRCENVDSLDLNAKAGNILPESIRRFENKWNNQGKWGKFTAKVSVTYGDRKQKIEDEVVFWIIPIYILIIIGLVLILLIILVVWLIRNNKARKIQKSKPEDRPRAVRGIIQ